MEDIILNLVNGLGISGLGFVFAFLLLKQKEKSDEQTLNHIDEICSRVDKLVEEISNLKLMQTQNSEAYKHISENNKTQYLKTSEEIESQNTKIDAIHMLCVKMNV